MRTDGKMSYKDFIFPVNPHLIKISHRRKASNQKLPYGKSAVSDLGICSRIISGEGEFCGENCIRDFMSLKAVMDRGGGGMLYIPSQSPVYAVFESLELTAGDTSGVIGYSFRFVESFENESEDTDYVISGNGSSSLWDIAYEYGADINALVRLNPHIRRPDIAVEARKQVRLC